MRQNIVTPALQNIQIHDPLFGRYADMIAQKLLPYQWDVLNDRLPEVEKSYCVENFRIAAGEAQGQRKGVVFCDTDAYKWLEAVAFCLASGRGREFEETADALIDLIGRAQEPDGYLNTYYTVLHPDKKWTNLAEGHELYCAGHLIEAAAAYYNATGKDPILRIACKLADLICTVFGSGDGKHKGCPGHQEIELALMKLSRVTGQKKYAELARYFLNARGGTPNYLLEELAATGKDRIFPEFADYDDKYAQTHLSPVLQTTAEGHAVRAMYMYSAMADVAREYNDPDMKSACRTLWDNVTRKRMYITGGIGSSGHLERFTTDYDLPNDRMYCESCASVGLMMFGQRMAALTGDAKYYDTVERALCNTVLAGISAEGDRYFYVNPLEVWPDNCLPSTSMAHVKPVRQSWFGVACCPSNIARTLASVGQYIFAQDEKSIYINQLISASLHTRIRDAGVKLDFQSTLMQDGSVRLNIETEKPQPFTIRIRVPEYWENPVFVLEGKTIAPVIENGYAVVAVSHGGVQTLTVTGKVSPRWVAANPRVRADAGRIALMYGPYVYCLEETDNGAELCNLYVSPAAEIQVEAPKAELPGALPTLTFTGKRLDSGTGSELYGEPRFSFTEQKLTAVPYGLWCNRAPGEMLVWLKADL
ncbi:MAG: glycoside hydrolase family 127 protein [Faecousia sp.]